MAAMSEVFNCDCMEFMRTLPDKFFDLAIVDPPYGQGQDGSKNHTRISRTGIQAASRIYKPYIGEDKHPPDSAYFTELERVSKNRIIWGANHFISHLPIPADSSCWIVWDKDNGECDFADCELAWTSFKTAVRKFRYRWNGMFQENMKNKEIRIHPNQKPVALYGWLLQKYAKEGDKIFDSHMGSGSSRVAAYKLGFDFWGCEMDTHYFTLQQKRFIDECVMTLNFNE